jgi:3',5'-cyclic-AMP phosphodiesterase
MRKASIHNDPFESQSNTQQDSISPDGIDRRGFLLCMARARTGLIWSFAGGVPVSQVFDQQMAHRSRLPRPR